jgi:autotransporter-associated beta strand protein
MKTNRFHLILAVSTATLVAHSGWAATVTKNNTFTLQANATDWSAAPATTDIGSFTGTLDATHAAGLTLGGNLAIGSLVFTNALAGPVTIGAGGTLTLNTAGTDLDLSAANHNVTLNCNVALGAAQTWNVAAARTLTVGGMLSGSFGLTETGGGTVSLSGNGSAVGALTVNGGTLALTGGDLTTSGSLILNNSGTAVTGLNVSGGSLTVKGTGFLSGNVGGTYNSTIIQTGGAITYTSTVTGQLSLANNGGTTTLSLIGGTFSSSDYWGAVLAQRGTTVATISGTAVATFAPAVYTGAGGLTLAGQASGNCTLNLDGGTLVVGSILKGNGTGSLNFNGGTLKSSRSLAIFMAGLTAAKVKAGGAVIDDGGFSITIGQALLTDTVSLGGGLTKKGTGTLTLNNTETYTGSTSVNAGTLALGASGALFSGSNINLAAGGTLDVSGLGASATYTLGSGATLLASGTGTALGTTAAAINGGATGTVNLGSRPVALTWGGASAGTDTTHPALTISQGTLALGGSQFTMVTGTALNPGVYTLVSAPAITGSVNPSPLFTGGSGVAGGNVGVVSISGSNVILTVSAPTATISATGPLAAVGTTYGSPSGETSFTLSGTSLGFGITVLPPVGYEVSTTSGSGYSGSGVSLTVGSPPTVPPTTVYVRLAAAAPVAGNYNAQTITLTSPGAVPTTIATAATGNAVTAKALTLASATAQGKLYDGTTATTVNGILQPAEAFGTGTSGDGMPYLGDILTVSCSGTFASAEAGTGISVTAGTFVLGGASAGNYTLTQPTGLSLTADIVNTAIWTQTAGGSWATVGNWQNNIVGTGSNNTADFSTLTLAANATATLDGARTIGTLLFDDQNATKHAWTLNPGSAGPLTLAVTSGSPVISASVPTTIAAVISGTQGLTKTGSDLLTLTGSNTYSGGTTIDSGTLATANFATPGTGAITIGASGTYAFSTTGANQPAFATAVSGTGAFNVTGSGGNQSFWSGDFSGFSGTMTIGPAAGWWARSAANTGSPTMKLNLTGFLALYDNESSVTRTFNVGELSGVSGSVVWGQPGTANKITLAVGALDTSSTFAGSLRNNWNSDTTSTLSLAKVGTGTLTLTGVSNYTGVTTVNAGTLELGGAGQLGSGSYAMPVTNSGTLAFNSTASQTLGGAISGTGSLVKANTGTLTLNGTSPYTGTTTVTAGTLAIGAAGTLTGSPIITVEAAGTLQGGTFATGQTLQGSGTLAGTVAVASGGTLSPGGAGTLGTLLVNGNLGLAGTTLIDLTKAGGIVTGDALDGTGHLTMGGTLKLVATGEPLVLGDSLQLFGAGVTSSGAFAGVDLSAAPLPDPGLSWDTSTLPTDGKITVVNHAATPVFNPAAGGYVGTPAVTITADSGSTIYYTTNGSDPTPASASGLSGAFTVTVAANSPAFTIKAFARKAGQPDSPVATATYATTDTARWVVDNNGNWSDAANWLANAIPDGSGVPVDFFTTPEGADTTVTLDSNRTVGSMTFGNDNPINWLLNATNSSVLTLAGPSPTITVLDRTAAISAALDGAGGLTKAGPGTLALAGANLYSGDTMVAAGTLQLGAANTIPDGAGKGDLVLTGTFDLNNSSETVNGLTGTGTVDKSAAGAATLTVGANDASSTFDGIIQNTGGTLGLTKTGAGTLTLTNAQTYTGNTSINGGTLVLPTGAAIGTASSGQVQVNGATLRLAGGSLTSNGYTTTFLANTSPATLEMSAGSLTLYAANQYWDVVVGNFAPGIWNQTGGEVNLNLGELFVGNWAAAAGSALNLSGGSFVINGTIGAPSRSVLIAVRCDASLNLSGTIAAVIPTVQYGHSPAVTLAGVTGTVNLDGGSLVMASAVNVGSGTAIFNFNGGLLKALADSATFMTGLTTANVRNGGARIDTDGHTITLGQALVHSGIGGDHATDGGLTKSGDGALVLTASNTYTGPTAINAGTLQVDGAITTSPVTVAATGTLAGTGSAAGAVTIGGTVAPGATGVGTLATGAAIITGTYACQLDGATSDKLAVTGNLDLNGATIHLSEVTPASASSYVIATYTGTLVTLATPPVFTGLSGYTLNTTTAGEVRIVNAGYGSWADSWSGPALSDKSAGADPDHDGIKNLLEYVLGGDPRVSSTSFLPALSRAGGNLVLS